VGEEEVFCLDDWDKWICSGEYNSSENDDDELEMI